MAQLPVPYGLFHSFVSPTTRFASPSWAFYLTSTKTSLSNFLWSPYVTMGSIPLERRILFRTAGASQKSLFGRSKLCFSLSNPLVSVTPSRNINLGPAYSGTVDHRCKTLSNPYSYRGWGFSQNSLHSGGDPGRAEPSAVNVLLFRQCWISAHHIRRPDYFRRHTAPISRFSQCKGGINSSFPATKHACVVKSSNFPVVEFCLLHQEQPVLGSMCITTSAWVEVSKAPLYSKRRRKKRKGPNASRVSSGPTTQEVQPVRKVEEKSIVVVESPAKAKTIQKYLEGKYVVLPSFGHVRDLAAKTGSVRPDEDFKMVWEVPSSARQHLNAIKSAVKGANSLVLASDPDREGEAIAWHVLEMLKIEGSVKDSMDVRRVVFNEITKSAVLRAMESPRDISATLVDAYMARRALDYLIGFDLSPVLWRKLPGSKSAGRVQSAALRLVCEREMEMEAFVPREYWTIDAEIAVRIPDNDSSEEGAKFPAKVTHVDGEKLSQFSIVSEEMARSVAKRVQSSEFQVSSVKKSLVRRNPPAPYITSTLQQDASSKLGFGATRTMALSQQLYEGVKLENDELVGLITYMRTDGVQLSDEAVQSVRSLISNRYGHEFVPPKPRQFSSRAKNAQEAHEAIRPTDVHRLPSMLVHVLEEDALRLYTLIWRRTVACQMEQAIFAQVAVDIKNDKEDLQMRANGSSLSYPGYLAVLKDKAALAPVNAEGSEEDEELEVDDGKLWSLEAGDLLTLEKLQPNQHFTDAPPRFSEGSLVKRLEELGIGRPSTYASTLRTLVSRNYIKTEKRRIFPEPRGRMVSAFLSHYFPKFSDYEFTAKLEEQLDEISAGRAEWKSVLMDFWPEFHEVVSSVLTIPIEEVVDLLEDMFSKQLFSDSKEKLCPSCGEGKIGLKLSRFGSGYFLGCSRYPTCMYRTNVLSADALDSSDDEENSSVGAPTKILGVDPVSGLQAYDVAECGLHLFHLCPPFSFKCLSTRSRKALDVIRTDILIQGAFSVSVKIGPFGRYLQLGSGSKQQKPKRSAIPKDMKLDEISLADALELLKYPVELGKHPETNAPVLISVGQYGLFLRCRGVFVSLPKEISPDHLSLEEAVELLKSKHVSKRGRKPQAQDGTSDKLEALSDKQTNSVKKPTSAKEKPRKAKSSTTASSKTSKSVSSDSREVHKKLDKVVAKEVAENKPAGENVESGNGNGTVQVKRPRGRPRKLRPEVQASVSVEETLEVKGR